MNLTRNQQLTVGGIALLITAGLGYGAGVMVTQNQIKNAFLSTTTTASEPESEQPPVIASNISSTTNPLDDTTKYTMFITSENQNANSIGSSEHITLIVRCDPSDRDVFINTPEYMSSTDNHTIALRWDGGAKINQSWYPSSGASSSAFSRAPLTLLTQMTQHDKLVIGYTPYGKTESAAIFDLKKHRKDLMTMKSHCS